MTEKLKALSGTIDPGASHSSDHSSIVESDIQSISGSLSSISVDDSVKDPDYVKDTYTEDSTFPPIRKLVKKKEIIGERVVGV